MEAAGLVWVGPTPEQIELLGDKIAAKAEAVAAGVPTTEAVVVTARVTLPDGLPVPAMVKAAAGGGGRGMRIVRDRTDMAEVVASAQPRGPRLPSATARCSWSRSSSTVATSRSRCWAIPTATSSTSGSATAPSSVATRR